jgi:hypothetical protein
MQQIVNKDHGIQGSIHHEKKADLVLADFVHVDESVQSRTNKHHP